MIKRGGGVDYEQFCFCFIEYKGMTRKRRWGGGDQVQFHFIESMDVLWE